MPTGDKNTVDCTFRHSQAQCRHSVSPSPHSALGARIPPPAPAQPARTRHSFLPSQRSSPETQHSVPSITTSHPRSPTFSPSGSACRPLEASIPALRTQTTSPAPPSTHVQRGGPLGPARSLGERFCACVQRLALGMWGESGDQGFQTAPHSGSPRGLNRHPQCHVRSVPCIEAAGIWDMRC